MSKHLFSYRDLLRILKQTTPTRAPGRQLAEVVEILLMISDLIDDELYAIEDAFELLLRIPDQVITDLSRKFVTLMLALGGRALENLREIIQPPNEEESNGTPE